MSIVNIIGVISLAAYYLLWNMKRKGWLLVFGIGIVAIIISIVMVISSTSNMVMNAIIIVFWIVVLGYLWKKKYLFK